jgi:hypothetical protein
MWCDERNEPDPWVISRYATRLCAACAAAKEADENDWPAVKFVQGVVADAIRKGATAMRLVPREANSMILQLFVQDEFVDQTYMNKRVARFLLRRLRKLSGVPEIGRGDAAGEFLITTKFGAVMIDVQTFEGSPTVSFSLSNVSQIA